MRIDARRMRRQQRGQIFGGFELRPAETRRVDEDEAFRVVMAAREAAVNAVLHGNGYDPNKKISASFENTGKSLVITVADEGEGLDPAKLPDPLAPENLLRTTGRGIFLIRSFMDEFDIRRGESGGMEVTLVKYTVSK